MTKIPRKGNDQEMGEFTHIPVLLHEAIENLHVTEGKEYIDATLGGGGHTFEILKHGGRVLGIDQDYDAIDFVQEKIDKAGNLKDKAKLALGNFGNIGKIVTDNGFEHVSGILFDLGFSSNQIEKSGRGFSFLRDEPLDMRMSGQGEEENSVTAAEILKRYSEEELYDIFSRFGEEPYSQKIARAIVGARKEKEILSTQDLVSIIKNVKKGGFIHPATLVFQALRIAVNNELENLKYGIVEGFEMLVPGGRLVVISFHSLEDRIVKNYFRKLSLEQKAHLLTKKPIIASDEEIKSNLRSRSAKMRVIEKK